MSSPRSAAVIHSPCAPPEHSGAANGPAGQGASSKDTGTSPVSRVLGALREQMTPCSEACPKPVSLMLGKPSEQL